ncbi:GNAT family N-acetyltransferase [Dinghuibacter silviterrae]|uniref:L-amino acid N-acyltransferase YncA n=1 Tax=Dinghuibacter silviterrae TaxID=1539049 RepID=A0A4R8DQ96_9BACT|nr:GNAT family N-acetyltransferase [Dinghuibacter silviterrae]TDX00304.1 L-amino acid N-acyltransferase YncA [Dinghuibacter silviterrae]
MHIRPATVNDFPSIHALLREFSIFQKTPEKMLITLEEMVAQQDLFRGLVAEEGGAIVGFATYFFSYYSWSGKALYLDDLYVQPAARGNGLGSRLLDAIIALARTAGCKKVRWQVSRWNEPAQALYRKIGASIDDTEINCDLVL